MCEAGHNGWMSKDRRLIGLWPNSSKCQPDEFLFIKISALVTALWSQYLDIHFTLIHCRLMEAQNSLSG